VHHQEVTVGTWKFIEHIAASIVFVYMYKKVSKTFKEIISILKEVQSFTELESEDVLQITQGVLLKLVYFV